jgi:hypothetical protein
MPTLAERLGRCRMPRRWALAPDEHYSVIEMEVGYLYRTARLALSRF